MIFFAYSNQANLTDILNSKTVRVASPFLSKNTINLIDATKHDAFTLITRLPTSYNSPTAFVENDPKPLIDALDRMGKNLKIYSLPTIHSKIYINDRKSWTGSANFTNNGFSGKPELLIQFDDVNRDLDKIFSAYISKSKIVSKSNLQKLEEWITQGLTEVDRRASAAQQTPDAPEGGIASYNDFLKWLTQYQGPNSAVAKILLNRAEGGNQMSGHVALAFNGVTSFLRKNPSVRERIDYKKWDKIDVPTRESLAAFIKKYGDNYRGVNGGYWRNYLSTRLGGKQITGGAGNTIVERCALMLPQYLDQRGL